MLLRQPVPGGMVDDSAFVAWTPGHFSGRGASGGQGPRFGPARKQGRVWIGSGPSGRFGLGPQAKKRGDGLVSYSSETAENRERIGLHSEAVMSRIENPFQAEGVWLKANLHTHTTNSDGDTDPPDRVAQYAEAGYDVLALTDHRVVTAVEPLQRDDITLIRGLEAHPVCPDGPTYHLVCLDVPADFEYDEGLPANQLVQSVRAAGGEVVVAHPYWCGHSLQHILTLENVLGLEVYNSTCGKIGKADSSMFWDYMLAAGRMLPGFAVDDVHRGRDIFMGWTMIRAASRRLEDVMSALRRGLTYASCGPEILDMRLDDGTIEVTCSPVREIHFMCRGSCGFSLYADGGEELTNASFTLPNGAGYVRIQCVDAHGRRAWTNPQAYRPPAR